MSDETTFTTEAVGPALTLDGLRKAFAEFRERFPEPDFWIYGWSMGPGLLSGPVGAPAVLMARLILGGLVEYEPPRWYWTDRARAMLYAMEGMQRERSAGT